MKAYIVNFILCMLLSFIADVMFKKNKKRMGIIFIILTILVMGIIAGVRSENVGTDIHNYVTSLFEYSYQLHTGIFDIYSKFGVELGFTILVFISSRFGDLNLVLFFIQLAIVLPIAIYSYKVKEQIPISINIFIFLMTMYSYSFSMMRQSVAISIGLLSVYYFKHNDRKKGFLSIMVAYLFHRTSIILLVFYYLIKYIYYQNKNSYFYLFIIMLLFFILSILLPNLISLLPIKYSNYLESRFVSSVNFYSLVKKVIWIIPIIICLLRIRHCNSEKKNDLLFSMLLIILDVLTYLIGIRVPTVSRLALYFTNISCFVYFPYILKMFKPRLFSQTLFIFVMIFLWWHMTTNDRSANIYPYKSEIITFLNDSY